MRERGPLAAGELSDPGKKSGPWWGYSKGKQTLEYLFWTGQVTANRTDELRARLRHARASDPGRGARRADARPSRRRARRCSRSAHECSVSARWATSRTTSCSTSRRAAPRSPSSSKTGCSRWSTVEGWKQTALPAPRRASAAQGRGHRAADALRQPRVASPARRAAVRLPLPHRDLHALRRTACTGTTCCPSCTATASSARVDVKADRKAKTLVVPGAFAEAGVDVSEVAERAGRRARAHGEVARTRARHGRPQGRPHRAACAARCRRYAADHPVDDLLEDRARRREVRRGRSRSPTSPNATPSANATLALRRGSAPWATRRARGRARRPTRGRSLRAHGAAAREGTRRSSPRTSDGCRRGTPPRVRATRRARVHAARVAARPNGETPCIIGLKRCV